MFTAYHAKYFAHDLTRRRASNDDERLTQSLFDASVDLNPHQIEAALFALKSPLSKGALLADEVGLGKTIEAGIVLCQYWSERRRRLLVICPASLQKQWALELQEKFNLPAVVLDRKTYKDFEKDGVSPFKQDAIIILSFNYANKKRDELRGLPWDLVVIDEAHKLRNCYRESNKMGQGIRWATEDRHKLLLTATPLQNSLNELYGLASVIDEHIFGDINAFRSNYVTGGGDIQGLRETLSTFCRRTLRRDVLEYNRYTQRRAITRSFRPTDDEQRLYEQVSEFLRRPDSYAIPTAQRHLLELIMRKVLASSSWAIARTLETLKARLEALREAEFKKDTDIAEQIIDDEEMEDELLDEILGEDEDDGDSESSPETIDFKKLNEEIRVLGELADLARSIGTDTKAQNLISALQIGFEQMAQTGAQEKALIFTESRRTQLHLKEYLEENGYKGKVVVFSGSNRAADTTEIYENWLKANQDTGRISGSRNIDIRTALIEHFRDEATILIATEAAAEGVNLQFCSLVINYDLPWNPQRVEQRIGRCHRYGQQHDVVVINFLNERNDADRRVLQLLTDKFNLFDGVFGASDEVLGAIDSGVSFEKQILSIYQECRTTEEIEAAFNELQEKMESNIKARMIETRKALLENLDEDVHARLRLRKSETQNQLNKFSKRFWHVTQYMLRDEACFDEEQFAFELPKPPIPGILPGRYHLISKSKTLTENEESSGYDAFLYRLSHPLGEYVLENAKELDTRSAKVVFNVSDYPNRLRVIEDMKGKHGFLILTSLVIQSYEREEYLLFSGMDAAGTSIDQEICEKLFNCMAEVVSPTTIQQERKDRLQAESQLHVEATINQSLATNNAYFAEAQAKLVKWAKDQVDAAEKALEKTKQLIRAAEREIQLAKTVDEQEEIQERIKKLQKQKRRQRQEIFDEEDEIEEKRDELIAQLKKRMIQKTDSKTLFCIEWAVV